MATAPEDNDELQTNVLAEESDEIDSVVNEFVEPFNSRQSPVNCPFNSTDWIRAGAQTTSCKRVKRDIAGFYTEPVPGCFIVPKENDLMCVHSMIIGNFDTPYEGGFFHFFLRFGPNYPYHPPRVCSMSCYRFGNYVRFNPNLYENGKVCLSILGTYSGPRWSAANNLSSVLLSIQSLLCDQALCNEPGYEMKRDTDCHRVRDYDTYVRHETLRVAVVHTVEYAHQYKLPEPLIEVMESSFIEFYDSYITACDENVKYDGQKLQIELRGNEFVPAFAKIKADLIKLHETLKAKENSSGLKRKSLNLIRDNRISSSESSLSEISDHDISVTQEDSPLKYTLPSEDKGTDVSSAMPSSSREAASSSSSVSGPVKKLCTVLATLCPSNGNGDLESTLKEQAVQNTKIAKAVKLASPICEQYVNELKEHDSKDSSSPTVFGHILDEMEFFANSDSNCSDGSDDESSKKHTNKAEQDRVK